MSKHAQSIPVSDTERQRLLVGAAAICDAPVEPGARHYAETGDYPRSVVACANNRWILAVWPKGGGPVKLIPYRCNSRRHPGPCRDRWAQQLYARVKAGALSTVEDYETVAFVTFTLKSQYHQRRSESLLRAANIDISTAVGRWADAMNIASRRAGLPALKYMWVREEHKSGVPHVHMLLVHEWCRECLPYDPTNRGAERRRMPPPEKWQARADNTGILGLMDATKAGSVTDIASYMSKVASTTAPTGLLGELTKEVQRGCGGARHRRDFGATRGFLAPVRKEENFTGALVNRNLECVDGTGPLICAPMKDGDEGYIIELDLASL